MSEPNFSRFTIPLEEEESFLYRKDALSQLLQQFESRSLTAAVVRSAKRIQLPRRCWHAYLDAHAAGVVEFDINGPQLDRYGPLFRRECAKADGAVDSLVHSLHLHPGPRHEIAEKAISVIDGYANSAAAVEHPSALGGVRSAEARVLMWQLATADVRRVQKIAVLVANGGVPLTGWDDPRFGPLWPDGPPAWHTQAEQLLRELRTKLANRPDPFAPLVADETRGQLDDHRKLKELAAQGAFQELRGEYVFVHNGELVAHGPDLAEARQVAAEKCGVPFSRLVYRFVS